MWPTNKAANNYALPPKPYTEYTIFFRLERAYILQSSGIIDEEAASLLDPSHCDPVELPRPAKYENLVLPPYWYSSSHKAAVEKKRKHRKKAGRIDLKTLSKTISASWRKADPFVIGYCRKLANVELKKFNKVIERIMKDQFQQKKPLQATTAVPSVDTQAKQQVDKSVTMKPPLNKTAPEFTYNGTISLVAIQKSRREPANFSEITGYTSSGPQNIRQEKLVIQKLQATQQHMMNIHNNASLTSLNTSSPFVKTNGDNCRDHSLTSAEVSIPYTNSTVANNNVGNVNNGVHPEIIPEKNKRKLARRSSAPPEFIAHKNNFPAQACMATRDNTDLGGGVAFMGVDNNTSPSKRLKRRSSMVNMPTNQAKMDESERRMPLRPQNLFLVNDINDIRHADMSSPAIQERSDCLQKEVDTGYFAYIPTWEKEVADELLDILDAPQKVGEPVTAWEKEDADKLLDILNAPQEISESVIALEKEDADEMLDLLNIEVGEW